MPGLFSLIIFAAFCTQEIQEAYIPRNVKNSRLAESMHLHSEMNIMDTRPIKIPFVNPNISVEIFSTNPLTGNSSSTSKNIDEGPSNITTKRDEEPSSTATETGEESSSITAKTGEEPSDTTQTGDEPSDTTETGEESSSTVTETGEEPSGTTTETGEESSSTITETDEEPSGTTTEILSSTILENPSTPSTEISSNFPSENPSTASTETISLNSPFETTLSTSTINVPVNDHLWNNSAILLCYFQFMNLINDQYGGAAAYYISNASIKVYEERRDECYVECITTFLWKNVQIMEIYNTTLFLCVRFTFFELAIYIIALCVTQLTAHLLNCPIVCSEHHLTFTIEDVCCCVPSTRSIFPICEEDRDYVSVSSLPGPNPPQIPCEYELNYADYLYCNARNIYNKIKARIFDRNSNSQPVVHVPLGVRKKAQKIQEAYIPRNVKNSRLAESMHLHSEMNIMDTRPIKIPFVNPNISVEIFSTNPLTGNSSSTSKNIDEGPSNITTKRDEEPSSTATETGEESSSITAKTGEEPSDTTTETDDEPSDTTETGEEPSDTTQTGEEPSDTTQTGDEPSDTTETGEESSSTVTETGEEPSGTTTETGEESSSTITETDEEPSGTTTEILSSTILENPSTPSTEISSNFPSENPSTASTETISLNSPFETTLSTSTINVPVNDHLWNNSAILLCYFQFMNLINDQYGGAAAYYISNASIKVYEERRDECYVECITTFLWKNVQIMEIYNTTLFLCVRFTFFELAIYIIEIQEAYIPRNVKNSRLAESMHLHSEMNIMDTRPIKIPFVNPNISVEIFSTNPLTGNSSSTSKNIDEGPSNITTKRDEEPSSTATETGEESSSITAKTGEEPSDTTTETDDEPSDTTETGEEPSDTTTETDDEPSDTTETGEEPSDTTQTGEEPSDTTQTGDEPSDTTETGEESSSTVTETGEEPSGTTTETGEESSSTITETDEEPSGTTTEILSSTILENPSTPSTEISSNFPSENPSTASTETISLNSPFETTLSTSTINVPVNDHLWNNSAILLCYFQFMNLINDQYGGAAAYYISNASIKVYEERRDECYVECITTFLWKNVQIMEIYNTTLFLCVRFTFFELFQFEVKDLDEVNDLNRVRNCSGRGCPHCIRCTRKPTRPTTRTPTPTPTTTNEPTSAETTSTITSTMEPTSTSTQPITTETSTITSK
ncbi:uncharacterized protein YMR317W-like [Centruroides sculpturatus]|uniref:uncharacterized protein YMR317W-like n=1 Tax=Centruroides sculpturatus TaxID=218467 RepID=UPI000C6E68B8|nr:uncharacterized protein YMR317W-like [Centruroides sculpturatus]